MSQHLQDHYIEICKVFFPDQPQLETYQLVVTDSASPWPLADANTIQVRGCLMNGNADVRDGVLIEALAEAAGGNCHGLHWQTLIERAIGTADEQGRRALAAVLRMQLALT